MAVSTVTKIASELTEEPTGHRAYNVLYEVITDDVNDGPAVVRQAAGLPKIGDTYAYGNDTDIFAACVTRGPFALDSVDKSRKKWRVPVVYSSRPAEGSNPNNNGKDNPVDWEWEVSGALSVAAKVVLKDLADTPIANAADEPFIPAPEMDEEISVITLKKNTATISIDTWESYRGSVNEDAIWGLGVGQAKLAQWAWTVRRVGSFEYIENNFEVHIKRTGWQYQPLNQGFREKLGLNADGTPNYRQIRDSAGNLIRQPHLLDARGMKLPAGQPPLFFDSTGALNEFTLRYSATFADIFPAVLPGPITY